MIFQSHSPTKTSSIFSASKTFNIPNMVCIPTNYNTPVILTSNQKCNSLSPPKAKSAEQCSVWTLNVQYLSSEDTEDELWKMYSTATWIFKYNDTMAFVSFLSRDDMERSLIYTKQVNSTWSVCLAQAHVSRKLQPFVVPRQNYLFQNNVCRKKLKNLTSFFLCANSTDIVRVMDWETIFPHAFAIHRTQNSSKVYIEYNNLSNARLDAKEAVEKTWTFVQSGKGASTSTGNESNEIRIRVACQLVSEESMRTNKSKETQAHFDTDLHMQSVLSSAISCCSFDDDRL
jgi:hypothetical protein